MIEAVPALTLDHLRAFAAWLAHGPGTVRQVATRADMHLVDLHPRTTEFAAMGALQESGQSEREGPIYVVHLADVTTPSATDLAQRAVTTLPIEDQVSIAAGIMAKHGKRNKRARGGGREQSEMPL